MKDALFLRRDEFRPSFFLHFPYFFSLRIAIVRFFLFRLDESLCVFFLRIDNVFVLRLD